MIKVKIDMRILIFEFQNCTSEKIEFKRIVI